MIIFGIIMDYDLSSNPRHWPAAGQKIVFSFWAKGDGKNDTYSAISPAHFYDLLDEQTYQRLIKRPSLLAEEYRGPGPIVIDEIQKLPTLLDEVHRQVQQKKNDFFTHW